MKNWPTVALAVLWAAPMIAMGLQRTVASVEKASATAVLSSSHRPDVYSVARLKTAESALHRSLNWYPDGMTSQELGMVKILIAESPRLDAAERIHYLDGAMSALKAGLAKSPARPHSWLRLAYAAQRLGREAEEVQSYLAISIATGSHIPELTFPRLDFLLSSWADLSHEQRLATADQIRIAWRQDSMQLLKLAVETRTIPIVSLALARYPAAQRELTELSNGLSKQQGAIH